ncbi:hypothetical protein N1030_03345 [Desulfovibrio mangrovi]|uniref:hypothetical protein n=1 Tax=Desulfovibrio mangrovi TaxID=2976983 RepID=UPI002247493A|nr:hypothetical protein [Desulfovibrio mangrovi]UZP68025.1 hypothetical protein N1030_03345 [Desulfovibrio mangrovi]
MSIEDEILDLRDDLADAVIEALLESGYRDLKAEGYEDFPIPAPVGGHIPDITAKNKKGITFIFEVVTKEFFAEQEVADRIKAFAEFGNEKDAQFVVIVPEGEEGFASAFIEDLEISEDSVEIWEA